MRTLKFIVDDQIIKPDPNCDFSNIVPGTEGYLKAEFAFSSVWDGCVKVAGFWSAMGREYESKVLEDGKTCMIPAEALRNRKLIIRVFGKKENMRLTTNSVVVVQNGGII